MHEYDPNDEYTRRLEQRRSESAQLERRHDRIANLRLLLFLAAIGIAGGTWWTGLPGYWSLISVALAFVALIVVHEITLRRKRKNEIGVAYYTRCLDRLKGQWIGKGLTGNGLAPPNHPYALDLDIFGEGSLFELMCTARTRAGEQRLAEWFCAPADPEHIRQRQGAVEELRHKIDLREDLSRFGEEVRDRVHPDTLINWAESPPLFASNRLRVLAIAMAILGIAGVAVWVTVGLAAPLVLVAVADLMILAYYKRPLFELMESVQEPQREFAVLSGVIGRFEAETFTSPYLKRLRDSLERDGQRASAVVARLDRLAYLMEAPRNALFAPIAIVLMWNIHVAFAMDRWRARWGGNVRDWLHALGDLEALCALAAYAYEHPGDPKPEIVPEGPIYDGKALAHPLIPGHEAVPNDVYMDSTQPLLMVSGSNMSGKSTLLRTVGVNAVLAYAGAPVRAKSLRLSTMDMGANMRVQDSVQEGKSRFYAEIVRLSQMQSMAEEGRPLLFLLDELLHGTNSHDRAIGAKALVLHFIALGSIGLVTSHDLAVTHIADEPQARGRNVHFEDHLEDGKLAFDYKLREGVVRKSNALELMQSVGLAVEKPIEDKSARPEN